MTKVLVHSLDDPRLDAYRQLTRTNLTRWSGRFIAEGRLVVQRLLASSLAVDSVLVSERRRDTIVPGLARDVPVYVVSQSLAEELLGYNFHAGVLACGVRLASVNLADALVSCSRRGAKQASWVVCPHITGPENLGTIIRLCVAFGVDGLLLGKGSADPFARRVLRVSMGTAFQLPIVESDDLASDLDVLNRDGFELVAATPSPLAEPLPLFRRPPRLALLLGNEFSGVAEQWSNRCSREVAIPMAEGADSLNVAVAAGILLYHLSGGTP